jgi:DNA-binding NtrC family response regulator
MAATQNINAWVVDDDDSVRWVLEKALEKAGVNVTSFPAASPALAAFSTERPDVVITDIRMPGMNGLEFAREVETRAGDIPVIVITAYSDLENAVSAYQSGAFEYLPKPFDVDEAVSLVKRAVQERETALPDPMPPATVSGMIGKAPAMQAVFRSIGRLSRSSMTVLITGESGTGKELVARALHDNSPRASQPFVALNTTAIAAELLESDDVRIVAATNQDLDKAVENGTFREDLYHRLNVVRINTPPLRERSEDIPTLMEHYLERASAELGTERRMLTSDALELLQTFSWPGNVRQLVNAARRLSVIAPGKEIRAADIPPDLGGHVAGSAEATAQWTQALAQWAWEQLDSAPAVPLLDKAMPEVETALIRVALQRSQGRKKDAAKLLGWGRNTLTRKMKELGLDT